MVGREGEGRRLGREVGGEGEERSGEGKEKDLCQLLCSLVVSWWS